MNCCVHAEKLPSESLGTNLCQFVLSVVTYNTAEMFTVSTCNIILKFSYVKLKYMSKTTAYKTALRCIQSYRHKKKRKLLYNITWHQHVRGLGQSHALGAHGAPKYSSGRYHCH